MPIPSVEQLKQKSVGLTKKLADKGDSVEVGEKRKLRKKIKRAQRKGRKLHIEIERQKTAAAKPAAASEAAAAE